MKDFDFNNVIVHRESKPDSLTAKADRTYAYIGAGFYDENAINLIDAKAVLDIPDHVRKFLAHESQSVAFNYYTTTAGERDLLDVLQDQAESQHIFYDKRENILVTAGAVNGFYAVCHALCNKNDVILALSPSYILFSHVVKTFGADMMLVPASAHENGFTVRPETLEDTIRQVKAQNRVIKGVFIVNPTNIDSRCWSQDEINNLAPIIVRENLCVIEDKVYDGLQYDAPPNSAFFSDHPDLKQRSIILDSVSKRFGATQWRVGWIYGPSAFIEAARNGVTQTIWSPHALYQKATALLLSDHQQKQTYLDRVKEVYKLRRDLSLFVVNGLNAYKQQETAEKYYSPEVLENEIRQAGFSPSDFSAGLCGFKAPIIPQAGMFLLIQAQPNVLEKIPRDYFERDLLLARLIYLHARVVILPPTELTLPEEHNLYRIEFGVNFSDLLKAFSNINQFTRAFISLSEEDRRALIENALENIQRVN